MRLQVRAVKVAMGTMLMLCDDTGKPIPGQTRVEFTNAVDDISTITVTLNQFDLIPSDEAAS